MPRRINRQVLIEIFGDSKNLEKSFAKTRKSIDSTTKGASKSLGKTSSGLAKISRSLKSVAGVAAGAFAVRGVVRFGKEMFDVAQETAAMEAKLSTVFGTSLPKVDKAAERAAHNLGLTNDQFRDLAGSTGDLLKPLGLTESAAADNSIAITELAGKLAVFNGKSVEDASSAINRAMLGSNKALESFGIKLDKAAVDALLAAKGQDKLTGAAKKQATALAVVEEITRQGTDAVKAFDTAQFDGVKRANNLRASLGEIKETIGRALIPAFDSATKFLIEKVKPAFSDALENFGPAITNGAKTVTAFIGGIVKAFRDAGPTFAEAFGNIGDTIGEVIGSFSNLGGDVAASFGESSTSPVQSFADVFLSVSEAVADVAPKVSDFAAAVLRPTIDVVSTIVGKLVDWRDEIKLLIGAYIGWRAANAALNLGQSVIEIGRMALAIPKIVAQSKLAAAAQRIWAAAQWALNAAMNANPIGLAVVAVAALAAAVFVAYKRFKPFRKAVDSIWQSIQRVVKGAVPGIKKVVAAFVGFGKQVVSVGKSFGKFVANIIKRAVELARRVVESLGRIPSTVGRVWTRLREGAAAAFSRLVEIARDRINRLLDIVRALPGKVADALIRLRDRVTSIGATIWRGLTDGVSGIAGTIRDALAKAVDAVRGAARSMTKAAKSVGSSLIDGIIDGVKSLGGGVAGVASSIANAVASAINSAIDKLNDLLEFDYRIPVINKTVGFDPPDLPRLKFHSGGIVPGTGDRLIIVQGGEQVTSRTAAVDPVRPIVNNYNITVEVSNSGASAQDIADEIEFATKARGLASV